MLLLTYIQRHFLNTCYSFGYDLHVCIHTEKADTVPHVAITIAIIKSPASHLLHFFCKATFADTGPITQSINAENDPRKAIIELNSGKNIETAMQRQVKAERSMMTRTSLEKRVFVCPLGGRASITS